nr:DNA internalization-related competence protein ComEC/Rec2 [Reinekea marinisedimentorum]
MAVLAGIMLIGLELDVKHVLPRSMQHESAVLTVCTAQKMTEYPDFFSVNARVVSQPDNISLRHVRLTIPASKIDQPLKPGRCIKGDFRLRQPLGFLTPGGFDSDRYFFSKHIDAKATLLKPEEIYQAPSLVQKLYVKRVAEFSSPVAADVWAALVLGWSGSLQVEVKDLFSSNQLMHLFVISGMHIGFIALFILTLTKLLLTPFSQYFVLPRGGLYGLTLGFVALYVSLLGWPVPATRALLMFAVPLLMYFLAVRVSWLAALISASVIISVLQPEAWLSLGAWLSFSSVAVILLLLRWNLLNFRHKLIKLIFFQCAMSLTVVPWAFISGFPINPFSAVLNLLITPVIGFVLLPLAFLLCLLPLDECIGLFEWVVKMLFRFLEFTSDYSFKTSWVSFSTIALVVALFVLLVWWVDNREKLMLIMFASVVAILMLFQQPLAGRYPTVTFYDVGHGSAVLIEDGNGRWLVDTGGGYGSENSFFERDLDRQIAKLDYLIVTHADSDHSMAVNYIQQNEPQLRAWSGQPDAFRRIAGQSTFRSCHQASAPSPYLRFIPVPVQFQSSDNNHSCIVLYETGNGRMILTGDADKTIEYFLLQQFPELFPFNVVLLGHHGSDSSSAADWLAANSGATYVVSTGDRSRPAWPAPRIKEWFRQSQQVLLSTAQSGTVRLQFRPEGIAVKSWETAYRNRLIN